MKKILIAVFIISTGILFSCNTASNDPKVTLTAFIEALSKKDIETARKHATAESKFMLDMMEKGMQEAQKSGEMEIENKFSMADMEMGEPKIEGDKATIPVTEKNSNETINYTLKKEGGEWKVAFDKNSLINTATEKLNEKGVDMKALGDSLTSGMEKLKDIDMDSLKRAVDEGMKGMDSLKQLLDNP